MSRAFAVFLQELRDGRTHAELTAQMADLLEKVASTGKAGSITLEIKVKPSTRGADVAKVTVLDAIKVKLPSPERGEDFFWLTEEHELSRNHPRQASLELRDISSIGSNTPPTTLKEASK